MRILMTVHHPLDKNSGASGSMWQLAEAYRALGHEVEIFCFDDLPARWPEQMKMLLFPWMTARHLRRRVRRAPLDVLDAHSGDAWVWNRFYRPFSRRARALVSVARSTGLEHAAHLERLTENRAGKLHLSRFYFVYHGGFRLWEVARSLRDADGCILLNSADQEFATEKLGVESGKTLISGNGIPDSFSALPLSSPANIAAAPPRIAVVGSYAERKGTSYSVPALQRLLEAHPNLEVGFFGTGTLVQRITDDFSPPVRARIRVVETFAHEELPNLLAPYRFQLLASLSEGFGKVLLEGMACGLACVTSDAPGPLEIARDGENALVVPRRDISAIVQAFERLLGDETMCQKLRIGAHATAQKHTWAAVARARLAFYQQIRAAPR